MKDYNHIIEIVKRFGYEDLLPLQKRAFQMREFYDSCTNVFITGDTSSGKTLIPLVNFILEREENSFHKMLFLVPYRALASQKKAEIEELVCKIIPNLNICVSTGELREDDGDIKSGNADIAVIIYEKAYQFTCATPNFLQHYNSIIFDEFALSEDEQRGITCDLMLLRALDSSRRIFILATPHYNWDEYINGGKFAIVRDAAFEQPLTPREELPIFIDRNTTRGRIGDFHDLNKQPLSIPGFRGSGTRDDLIEDLCIHHLDQGHRVIVFMNNCQEVRLMAEKLANRLRQNRPDLLLPLRPNENDESCFNDVLEQTGLLEEDLIGLMTPRECANFKQGISYHNSWLGYRIRTLVEKELLSDSGHLKVVFSTETIAYGINSSVDVVIVADMHKNTRTLSAFLSHDRDGSVNARHIIHECTSFLKVNEYLNYIGRAGRYGHSKRGYAYALLTQTPGKADVREAWQKLTKLRKNPPTAVSAFMKLDRYCNTKCEYRNGPSVEICNNCPLLANEFSMPILSLIPPEGATAHQLQEKIARLPGTCENNVWLEKNVDHALYRLEFRTGSPSWIRSEMTGPKSEKTYFLRSFGKSVCGRVISMYECDCLRTNLFETASVARGGKEVLTILSKLKTDPFDLFYTLCDLPALKMIADDYYGISNTHTPDGRKRLINYNELCTQKLNEYNRKVVSKDLYEELTVPLGNVRVYRISNPQNAYRVLLAITIYEWYHTASLDALESSLNAVANNVVITPGRISNMTQQTAFYLQTMAAMCGEMLAPVYETLKDILLQMELCLYFGIRESNAAVIPVEQLRGLTRQDQQKVSKIMEFCSKDQVPPKRDMLTRRQTQSWKQILQYLHSLPKDNGVVDCLRERYPILSKAEKEFTEI